MTLTVMRTSETQRNRTKEQEGLKLNAYPCTAGKWTVGWGHAETNPRPVRGMLNGEYYEGKPKKGVTITLDEARRLFDADIDDVERQVSALISVDLAQHQYDSLIDFVFQFGIGNLTGSTLVEKINKNPNNLGSEKHPGILDEFPRWNRENGVRTAHVWQRSCRRACIYNGSPIPQALWRKNGFPFALTADDEIDYTITPTIHKIITHGQKAAEKPAFPPAAPEIIAEPLVAETIVAEELPKPAEELVLTEPAPAAEEPPPAPEPIPEPLPPPVGGTPEPLDQQPPSPPEAPVSTIEETLAPAAAEATAEATVKIEAKNPVNSWTIWGGAALYFLPDFAPVAEKLLTVEIAGPIGVVLRTTALVLLVLGRVSASLPVSIKAKAKLPKLRKQ